MARDLDTIKSEIQALKEKSTFLKKNGEISKKYITEYNALLSEQSTLVKGNSKDMLAARKSELNISKTIQGLDSKILKSNQSKLSLLLKGNIAGLLNTKYTTSTLSLQKKQVEAQDSFAKKLKDSVVDQRTTNKIRKELLGLQEDVGSGLAEEVDLADRLNDIEGLSGIQKLNAFGFMQKQAKARVDITDAEKEGEEAQERINDAMGKGLAIFGLLAGVAIKFSATIDKIGETFGSLTTMSPKLKNNLIGASVEATKLGGGIEDAVSITNTLASNFGLSEESAAKLSGKVFDTSKALGLSGDEAANLFGSLMQTANLSAEQAESLAEGTFQLARQNGVAPSAVMKDIAGSAEEIASFTQDGGDNIAEAAVQARKMGLSLSTTAKIAEGLLDFESSISKEVEASVLIGKQLNFQKAREAALSGDIAKATQEVVKQVGSEADFNKLNVIQRKALADSIGVSVTEMSKLVGQTDKLSLSGALASGSFGDLLGKDSLSALSQATAQIKALGASVINDLGPPLLSIVEFLSPIVSGFARMVSSLSKMGALLPIITAALGGYAAKSMYSAYTSLAAGAMKLPPPFNIVALGVGLGALTGLLGQAKKVDDFKSGPGGITHMTGPAGSFELNPKDSVLATTNPIPVNDYGQNLAMGGGNTGDTNNRAQTFKSIVRGNDIHNFVSIGKPLAGGTTGEYS